MDITVAICTWNRARLLDDTLSTFHQLVTPAGLSWELVVVDNNSTDDTAAVLDKHRPSLPLVTLFEKRAGKSYAANLAAANARGELLVWTDDDVRLAPGWLSAYHQAAQLNRDASYFAGPIDPWFEVPPPPWMLQHMAKLSGVFVVVDHGPVARRMTDADAIFGANMAFRTKVAREFPLNENLGRIKGSLLGADDTELIRRVLARGHHGVWVPDARLQHFNPAARQTLAYLKRWYRDAGRSLVRQGGVPVADRTARTIPPWIFRKYLASQTRRLASAWMGGERWFESFTQTMRLEGIMDELRNGERSA